MKNRFIQRVIVIAGLILFIMFRIEKYEFIVSSSVEAGGDLTVDYGTAPGEPLFVVRALSPGQSVSKNITIHNDAPGTRMVGIRGHPKDETSSMSQVLFIIISERGKDVYGGSQGQKTVADFFKESTDPNGIPLTAVSARTGTRYQITVIFDETAGNNYQDAYAVFDLITGVSIDLPDECEDISYGTPVIGTHKHDTLIGTAGNDVIMGFEGNDVIVGNGGNDCLIAGEGIDIINGGAGKDMLFGEKGNDILVGGIDTDILSGGDGIDITAGGAGIDRCDGELKTGCEL